VQSARLEGFVPSGLKFHHPVRRFSHGVRRGWAVGSVLLRLGPSPRPGRRPLREEHERAIARSSEMARRRAEREAAEAEERARAKQMARTGT